MGKIGTCYTIALGILEAVADTATVGWMPASMGSRCCIGLSIPGMIFLSIVGFLFDAQPLYTSVDVDDPESASLNCYLAALLYAIAILLSCVGIQYEKKSRTRYNVMQDEQFGEERAELLGVTDSGYGALSSLSQMPVMPQGYSRSSQNI